MDSRTIVLVSQCLLILASMGWVSKASADPPASFQSTSPNIPGVIGESQEAEGVRGVGHKGAGVSGTSEKWLGVYGESQEAEGVRGVGHKGAGVSGTSEKWLGVYGESQEAEGVRGVGHKGAGVSGTSEKWVGIYGKGGHLAGLLDGNVNITRDLIVNGKIITNGTVLDFPALLQRIVLLEQEVARLKNQSVSPPPVSSNYNITVSVKNSQFVLAGTGFLPNKDSYIHIIYPDLTRNVVTQTADTTGKLSYAANTSTWCVSAGMDLTFSVNQPDSSGRDKWSNPSKASCP